MTVTYIFGTEDEPKKVIGDNAKECLAKIKKHFVEKETIFIKHNKNMVQESLEFGEIDSEYSSWVFMEAIEEAEATITEINGAKSMAGLETVLQSYYDPETKIIEEKFNTKK